MNSVPEWSAGSGWAWLKIILALLFLLPFIYISTRFYAQRVTRNWQGRYLRVIEACTLNQGSQVYLLAAVDRVLLVGVNKENISLLGQVEDPSLVLELLDASGQTGRGEIAFPPGMAAVYPEWVNALLGKGRKLLGRWTGRARNFEEPAPEIQAQIERLRLLQRQATRRDNLGERR